MWSVAVIWLKYCCKRHKTPFNQSINQTALCFTKTVEEGFTKWKFFRLVQIQSIGRQQNKCNLKQKFFLGWVENILGKGETADYQYFLFPQSFQKLSFSVVLQVRIVWERVKDLICCLQGLGKFCVLRQTWNLSSVFSPLTSEACQKCSW